MASKPRLLATLLLGGCASEAPPEAWPTDGCRAAAAEAGATAERDWQLSAADGTLLAIAGLEPRGGACRAALLLTPGGLQPGLSLLTSPLARALSSQGLAVYTWDPRGRGESGGAEDANGATGQDDLAAVLRWVAARPTVDPQAVSLYTRSLGGALGAGALARHTDLMPAVWIDYEGPGWLEEDLDHASGQSPDILRALAASSSDPEAWWAEREPAGFITETRVPYHRLQGLPDHALGTRLVHALAMVSGGEEAQLNSIAAPQDVSEDWIRDRVVSGGLSYDGEDAIAGVRAALSLE